MARPFLLQQCTGLFFDEFFLFDPCFFAHQIAQIEEACPADFPALQELDFGEVGRREWEDSFYAYAIGYFAHRESLCGPLAFDLDDIAAEGLNPFFVTFDDFIADHDVVARAESGEIPRRGQLLVNKLDGVHWYML